MKKLNLLVVTMMMSLLTYAQDGLKNENALIHHVDLAKGLTAWVGLSYRCWPEKYGIPASFLPIVTPDYRFFSTGVKGLIKFHEGNLLSLIVYLSNNFNSGKSEHSWTGTVYKSNYYSVGAGPGFSIGNMISIDFGMDLHSIF